MKQRNESIDFIKGIAIIFVIIGHAIQRGAVGFNDIPVGISVFNKLIEMFNMPIFFLIAGYLFAKSNRGGGSGFIIG